MHRPTLFDAADRPHGSRRPRLGGTLSALAALVLAALVAAPSALAWDANAFSSTAEQQLFALTNQARSSAGLRTASSSAILVVGRSATGSPSIGSPS